jgi:methylenetetrahydrofolate reductase (NADPH)
MALGHDTQSPAEAGRSKESIVAFAETASLEVTMPSEADIELLAKHLKAGTEVFLSDVPRRSAGELVKSCERLAAGGLAPVPHVAVRKMTSANSFERLLAECVEVGGVRKTMLIAGDQPEPNGPFADVAEALRGSDLRRCGVDAVAVAAYPEGHPHISAEALDNALTEKLALMEEQGLEKQIVSQFGFDSKAVGGWLAQLRRKGIRDLVSVGMAGPASTAALMRFAMRCGVRTAARGLVRDANRLGGLFSHQPERLIGPFAAVVGGPESAPVNAHFFAFGGVEKTARWIRALQRGQFSLLNGAIHLDAAPN